MMQAFLTAALILRIIPRIQGAAEISSPDRKCDRDAVCTPVDNCPYWKEKHEKFSELRKNKKDSPEYKELLVEIRSSVCNKQEKGVCCYQDQESDKVDFLPDDNCGFSSAQVSNIFGGAPTKPAEFPFLALLGTKTRWICGGTLINKWYVLTAAHCRGIEKVWIGAWTVKGFRSDLNQKSGLPAVQDFDVGLDDFIAHPLYRRTIDNVENDIALIKLPRKVNINWSVEMVCLPLSERKVAKELGLRNLGTNLLGKQGTVVGWGYTCYEHGAQFCNESAYISSTTQNKLKIPIVPNEKCGESVTTDQMCAGGERGKDACKGDSGGPLVYKENDDSPWYLLGVVSLGSRICADGTPTTFTRITSYVPWIKETIQE